VRLTIAAACLLCAACGHRHGKVIVIGVDGMDPGFVERHWDVLPNLARLRRQGSFSRLRTTTPPQSPVAWSTFITGLDPDQHGIYDFVRRDPKSHEIALSTDRTIEPQFRLSLGPWELPLQKTRVESLRRGTPFWQTLADRGVPVTVIRMPTNYPPVGAGREIAGMGTPDLRGTQGTFTYYTDNPDAAGGDVPGGMIRKAELRNDHAELVIPGPPNSLRKDRVYSTATMLIDIDPERPVARFDTGRSVAVIQEGEWSDWMTVDFPLLPHVVSATGMFRVYAKRLRPRVEIYISPVNIDPEEPALPISSPSSYAKQFGRFYTLGIPEDTASLRQGVFDLGEFLSQTHLVLEDEQRMLREALQRFDDGFLFFYFSSVDQNSHILWGKHDDLLTPIYHAVDSAIGEAMTREPDAAFIVMSDHGFSTFDRAVNLNTWLRVEGLDQKAHAVGLNALYLDGADREDVSRRLLAWRDPKNGTAVVKSVTQTHGGAGAPDLIIGYSPGYRASWATGVGDVPPEEIEDNQDAWIADHCINAADITAVLFASKGIRVPNPSLRNLSAVIMGLFQ